MLKKKIWANFQRNIELYTQKIVTKLSKIWFWDPGYEIRDTRSGIRKKPIPDRGVKKAPDPGSGSATLHLKLSLLWIRIGSDLHHFQISIQGMPVRIWPILTVSISSTHIFTFFHIN
jgi:hypothetical protein